MSAFDSELHALVAGGISAVLDFSRWTGLLTHGRQVSVEIGVDEDGNYQPWWLIKVGIPGRQPAHVFRLRLEQEKP
jgi:hypothetical protein